MKVKLVLQENNGKQEELLELKKEAYIEGRTFAVKGNI